MPYSSLKVRLFMALESFLRVPPLLIVDEIFRISFGLGNANKYATNVSSASHKTTTIPDKLELSELERLSSNYTNETVSVESTPPVTSQATLGLISSFPVVNEVWQVISDALYHVFSPDSPVATAATASSVGPSPVTTTTIVEEVQADSDLVGSFEASTAQAAADLMKILEFLVCLILFFVAVITFMLATENLIKLYSHLVAFFSLYLAYIFSPFPAIALATIPSLVYNMTCRTLLVAVYYACRSWPGCYNLSGDNSLRTTLTEGVLLGMFFLTGATKIHPVLYVIIMVALHHPLVRCLPDIFAFLKSSWNETKRVQNEYGLSHLIQVESGRLRVNTVFRLFWITRAGYDAVSKCCNEPFNSMFRYVMTHGTETFTGIVGLTVTVSAICHHIGEGLLYLLYNGANTEADANRFGSISTVLFFILSLQTGLTSLDPEKRLDRLMKNIVLLGTALFHALHQMIAPVLTAFRAFQTLQIRAAVLSCSFFLMSGCLTYYLLRYSTISTWSLAVLALAIEFKIKIFISLLISFVVYLSQLVQYPEVLEKFVNSCRRVLPTFVVRFFDHLHDQLSHEDVVFYLKSAANVAEFLTGIFLFANAVFIFVFESASAIRAIGMSVHAYFNIWCEAQKGFRIYCQRKTASQKIMSLADATDDQLRSRHDDVCAVCYEEMESAKVTNCNHLFHAVCLRKWLYVQNTCPLCHEVLYREDALEGSDNAQAQGADYQNQNPRVPPAIGNSNGRLLNVPAVDFDNSFEVINPSDDNDTDADTSSNNNGTLVSAASSSNGGVRRNSLPAGVFNGIRFVVPETDHAGNSSSSGTDFTVDDGSDGDELWAEEYSSSDDDDDDNGRRRRIRERREAIGVPLLL
ncbi:Protein TRC8 [Orchesella cincta]|uniref:Protein TRC8 n=1 Tax=Orchesella cincta TaxID=48709 RepID=A0A1D2NJU0_ORCCI|nr:Protein TRC8 [Orchesella cincta]